MTLSEMHVPLRKKLTNLSTQTYFIVATKWLLCVALILFSLSPVMGGNAQSREKTILLLYSVNVNFAPDYQIVQAFNRKLSGGDIPLRMKHFELNIQPLHPDRQSMANDTLKEVLPDIQNGVYDVIIPLGQTAVDQLVRHAEKIPAKTAVVYSGLDITPDGLLDKHPNSTGIFGRVSLADNIELGVRLFPETRKVMILANWCVSGSRLAAEGARQQSNYPHLEIQIPDNATTPLNRMLELVRSQSPDTLILFYSWFNDDTTNLVSLQYMMARMEQSKAPIFALQEPMLWDGAVGGVFAPVSEIGELLADGVERILRGTSAAQIPTRAVPLKTVVNWNAVKQGRIREKDIPYSAEVAGKQTLFREDQIPWIAGAALGFVVFIFMLALLAYLLLRLKLREKITRHELEKLRIEEARAQTIVEAVFNISPTGISIKDADDGYKFIRCNKAFAAMVERPEREMIGKDDFELKFSSFNANTCIAQDKSVIQTGKTVDLIEQTHPGFPDNLAFRVIKMPMYMSDGKKLVLGMFIDVTEHVNLETEQKTLLLEKSELLGNAELVSDCLKEAVLEVDFERAIRKMLTHIGKRIDAGHCDIFRFRDDCARIECAYAWMPEDDMCPLSERSYPLSDFPGFRERMERREEIAVGDFTSASIPAFAVQMADRFGIKSLFIKDIWVDGRLAGFLKVDFTRRVHVFNSNDLRVMSEAVNLYGLIRARDFQMRKLAEQTHQESQIFDNIDLPMLLLDSEKNIILANTKSTEVFGDALIGKKICDTVCRLNEQLNCDPEKCSFLGIVNGNVPFMKTVPILGRTYQMRGQPVLGLDGKLVRMLATYVDVTDLNNALMAAQAANRAKGFFLASVSHEVRTPLNAVIGFAELLRDRSLPETEREDYLESIAHSGDALLQLIDDVLTLSRLESGEMPIASVKTDLNKLCAEMTEMFRAEAQRKQISLELNAEDMPPLWLDAEKIRLILWNLIDNAVKFTDRGGVTVTTAFQADSAGRGMLRFSVTDTGPGIPDGDREKLYQPFVQMSRMRGTNSGKSGTGLGLAVTRRMVELMKGNPTLESVIGQGSCFGVVLPDVSFETSHEVGTGEKNPAPPVTEVLVVDDVPMNLKVLSCLFKKLGITAATASGGREALAVLEEMHIDLVLTDLWMPEINGEELARKIRADRRFAAIRVVAVTADTDAGNNFKLDVFDRVIQKPVTIDKLKVIL